jgi:hypothetical protein
MIMTVQVLRTERLHRYAAKTFAACCGLALGGCSFLNPYSDKPTYTQGEKPSIAFASISAHGGDCPPEGSSECRPTGKVIQTRPDTAQSYQFFRYDDKHESVQQVMTCASPAEVARALSVSGSVGFSVAPQAAQSASAAASSATQQAITVIQPADAASHYIAAASYYNCLNFASGMYGTTDSEQAKKTATAIAQKLFGDAIQLSAPASAKSDGAKSDGK